MVSAANKQRDLERIDRELAGCQVRLSAFQSMRAEIYETMERCIKLDQDAADFTTRGMWAEAEVCTQLSHQLQGSMRHWSKCIVQEKEMLTALRMNREYVEKRELTDGTEVPALSRGDIDLGREEEGKEGNA